jgi:hypothetical protein
MQGWKTIAVAVVSFCIYLFAWPGLTELIDAQTVALISAALMAAMRFLTSTPLGKKRV